MRVPILSNHREDPVGGGSEVGEEPARGGGQGLTSGTGQPEENPGREGGDRIVAENTGRDLHHSYCDAGIYVLASQ